MRVFKEKQKFTQWWIYAIFTLTILYAIIQFPSNIKYSLILIATMLICLALFAVFTLETKIDRTGIHTFFKPLPFCKKSFRWGEIKECYVREYSPLSKHGGWGIRGFGKKSYKVKGNIGIQIHTKSKTSFLIGTQEPKKAQKTIERYCKPNS